MTRLTHVGRELAQPSPTPETAPYWEGAGRGELWLRRCEACGLHHHYPRAACPFCFAPETAWVRASGRGELYSYSIVKRISVPYAIAWVKLDEGPTMMTNVIDCEITELRVGMRLRLAPPPSLGGPPIPMFVPDSC